MKKLSGKNIVLLVIYFLLIVVLFYLVVAATAEAAGCENTMELKKLRLRNSAWYQLEAGITVSAKVCQQIIFVDQEGKIVDDELKKGNHYYFAFLDDIQNEDARCGGVDELYALHCPAVAGKWIHRDAEERVVVRIWLAGSIFYLPSNCIEATPDDFDNVRFFEDVLINDKDDPIGWVEFRLQPRDID